MGKRNQYYKLRLMLRPTVPACLVFAIDPFKEMRIGALKMNETGIPNPLG